MLLITGLFSLLLFLFATPVFFAIVLKRRGEFVLLPALLCNAYLLYIAAICHWTFQGFQLIYALNLSLYIPVLFTMKKIGFAEAKRRLATPGIVFAAGYIVLYFLLTLWRNFYSWDEISHWGAAAKLFLHDGRLGCEFGGILSHASYPPGATLVSTLTHLCFWGVPFREHIIQLGSELLLLFIWVLPFGKLQWNQRFHVTFACLAYCGFIPIFLREDFHSCYTDAPLACLFAIGFYMILTLKRPTFGKLFTLAIVTSYMFFVRNAGFGYAIALQAFFLYRLLFERKNLLSYDAEKECPPSLPSLILGTLLFLALPLAVKQSWAILLQHHHTPLKFSGNGISALGILRAFFCNEPAGSWIVIRDFALRLLSGYIEAFLLILYCLFLLIKKSCSPLRRHQARQTAFFFSVMFTLFLLGTLVFYIFEFHEKKTLPSFDRYVSAFLLIVGYVTLLLWGDEKSEQNIAAPAEQGFGVNTILRKRILLSVGIWCVLANIYNMIPYGFFRWEKHRIECDRMHEYDEILQRPGVRFTLITSTGIGFKNFYGSYLYPWNFKELEQWDPVLKQGEGYDWLYAQETTPEKLRREIMEKHFDYVYMESLRPEFLNDFKSLFVPGTQVDASLNNRLFKVLPSGLLEPVPVPQKQK